VDLGVSKFTIRKRIEPSSMTSRRTLIAHVSRFRERGLRNTENSRTEDKVGDEGRSRSAFPRRVAEDDEFSLLRG